MATKRRNLFLYLTRNLFLYLTLTCFLGIIAIFIVDGYLGVYDTIYVTAGEWEQPIEPDYWLRGDQVWSTGVNWGEKVFFRHEVDNRRFSRYSAEIEASVWRSQEEVRDLGTQQVSIAAFKKGEVEWVVDTTELFPGGIAPEQRFEHTVVLKREDIERKIIVFINYVPKPVPAPPR